MLRIVWDAGCSILSSLHGRFRDKRQSDDSKLVSGAFSCGLQQPSAFNPASIQKLGSKIIAPPIEAQYIIIMGGQKKCVPALATGRHLKAFLCMFRAELRQLRGFFFYAEGVYQVSAYRFLKARLHAQVSAFCIHCQQTDSP